MIGLKELKSYIFSEPDTKRIIVVHYKLQFNNFPVDFRNDYFRLLNGNALTITERN